MTPLYIESDGTDPRLTTGTINALRRICPDPALQVQWLEPGDRVNHADGRIVYDNPTVTTEECFRLYRLANAAIPLVIRTRNPGQVVYHVSDDFLGIVVREPVLAKDQPGFTSISVDDLTGAVTSIDLVFEPTDNLQHGYYCYDVNDEPIRLPLDVIIAHELRHAEEAIDGVTYIGVTDDDLREKEAIAAENHYRRSRGLPERWGHEAGNDWKELKGLTTGGDCFIATAAYGSELADDVQELRSFRDDILLHTRVGADFFEEYFRHYYRLSPVIVQMMHQDPEVRELVRWSLVAPIVEFLRLAKSFPRDADLDALPEPWRSYITGARDAFERWTEHLPLPGDLAGVDAASAGEEVRVAVEHLLWRPGQRQAYLDDLTGAGELPLHAREPSLRAAAAILAGRGADAALIETITGIRPGKETT